MKTLIILRAGQSKIHESWSLNLPKDFDLIISYYDEKAYVSNKNGAIEAHLQLDGGKWDNIYKILSDRDLSQYDYFWFPDDDVEIVQDDLLKFFKIGRDFHLKVFQPSLTHDSYFTFIEVVQSKMFKLRYTQFVEIMCPCLHLSVLLKVLHLFKESKSGYGLDLVWCRLAGSKLNENAIIDVVSMKHTRPVGGMLKQKLASEGVDIFRDMDYVKSQFFEYTDVSRSSLGGILRNGKFVSGPIADWLSYFGWVANLRKFRQRSTVKKILRSIRGGFRRDVRHDLLLKFYDGPNS